MNKKILLLATIAFVSLSTIAQEEVVNGRLTVKDIIKVDGKKSNDEIQIEPNKNGYARIAFHELRFRDWTISSDMMTMNNGQVGIGTSSMGSHKLAVEGSIGAREVKVEPNGWSDFVFEKDYTLPTLEDVESYIQEKGHLKDIPSAEQVKESGILLGEMDAKLLKKIEELTLYVIDMNKRIVQLEEENSRLKNESSNSTNNQE
ncbi:MAG: hypothetical protein AAF600_15245 [Bacteroidota bacterium]